MEVGLENSIDKKINYFLKNSSILGTIGSPSSTIELALDVLESSVTRQLVGELAIFKYLQDSKNHYAIGQIIEITLKNFLLEDPTIKSVARKRGSVNPISGIQDVHVGKLLCSAIFTSSEDLVEHVSVGEEFSSSDHRIVRFLCNFSSGKVDNKRLVPCFRRTNFDVLRRRLAEVFKDRLESVGVVSQWEEFSTKLSSVLHDVIPFVRKKRVCTSHPLWFTDSVRNLYLEKKRAFREYKSGRGDLSLFTDKRRLLKKAIRDSKKQVESRLADNIGSDPKSLFRYVNYRCKRTFGSPHNRRV